MRSRCEAGSACALPEQLRVHDVELHVMAIHLEVGPNQMGQVVDARLSFEKRGAELHIEECAAGLDVVHLASRLEDRRGATPIAPLDRRDAFRDRLPIQATIRPSHR